MDLVTIWDIFFFCFFLGFFFCFFFYFVVVVDNPTEQVHVHAFVEKAEEALKSFAHVVRFFYW